MTTSPVRDIGTVRDIHGYVIRVGVDHDSVTIGGAAYAMLGPEARGEFAKLFMQADAEARAYAAATQKCNACAGPASCSEFGRCVLEAGTCQACWHQWSLHGPGGCTAKVYPAHSLTGEPCPCKHADADPEVDPVTGQARNSAIEPVRGPEAAVTISPPARED